MFSMSTSGRSLGSSRSPHRLIACEPVVELVREYQSVEEGVTVLVQLAEAYCPDVPSYRESRSPALHGIRPDIGDSGLGRTMCGLLCNPAEQFPMDLIAGRICKRCMRNRDFAKALPAK